MDKKQKNQSGAAAELKALPEHAGSSPMLRGYLVQFDDVGSLIEASRRVRDEGFREWDAHTPFPVHGLNEAMGLKPTLLQWVVLGAALCGLGTAVWMQWWMNAVDYPLIVSGKPYWSIPANVPIYFELTVLFSGLTIFLGMFAFNKLPQYHHAVFSSERFERATDDKFFISIMSNDPKFDRNKTAQFMNSLGGSLVEELEA
jgi:hypothetical protein